MIAAPTPLDILVLVVVGSAAVLGFMRGFVSEVTSLAAWLLAISAVKIGFAPLSAALRRAMTNDLGIATLAFVLLFGLTLLSVRMAGRALGRHSRASVLGPFDRMLGLGFGMLKGIIAATLIYLFLAVTFDVLHGAAAKRPDWMTASRSYPLLRASGEAIVDYVDKRRKG